MKLKCVLLVGALLCSLCLHAQEQKISLKCLYIENYIKEAGAPESKRQDEFALDISSDGQSAFYSIYEKSIREMRDTLLRTGMSATEIMNRQADMPRTHQYLECYKHFPTKGSYLYFNKVVKSFYYEEALPVLKWRITSDTKTVLDYKCQKAITELDNRTWEVWFTMDIPISDGPWLLAGLPGLILEAADTEGIFHFTAIEIKKQPVSFNMPDEKRCIKCTRKEFISMRKQYDENPEDMLKRIIGQDIQMRGADGKPMKGKAMNYFEKE